MIGLLVYASLLAPPTLADGLRNVGALQPLDERLMAPPPPARTGAKVLLGVSGAMLLAGVVGYAVSSGCATRDADRRCVDARGSHPAFPSLIVLGLGGLSTGAWWYRRRPDLHRP